MDDCAFIEFDKFDKSIQGLIPVSKLANATSSAYLFTMLNDNTFNSHSDGDCDGDGYGDGDGDGKMSHTWLTHSPEQGEMVSHGPEFVHLMVFFGYGYKQKPRNKN